MIEKYHDLISDVEYIYTERPGVLGTLTKVSDKVATDFITKVNKLIVEKIDNHFKELEKQMEPFEKLK